MGKTWGLVCIFYLIWTLIPSATQAGLYFYKDKNGVLHITNVAPPSNSTPHHRAHKKARLLRFWPYIKMASHQSGIDPLLLAAVVLVESGCDPRALSTKGAIGLTQLMPATAMSLGVDPQDPYENLLGGAQYLRKLITRFDGDILLALAAYNAGPATVEKSGDIPPYKETQQYVRKVLLTWKKLMELF